MRYFGGKNRSGKLIASKLNNIIKEKEIENYVELFVGSGGVFKHIKCENKIINDKEPLIIEFHKHIASGGKIELEYEDYYKDLEPIYNEFKKGNYGDTPLGVVGYVAYQCSFGGMKFRTFARDKLEKGRKRDYFKGGLSSLLKKQNYKNTKILNLDFRDVQIPKNSLIYCDPPYKSTNGYSVEFDNAFFENYINELSKDNIVIISEYSKLENTDIYYSFEFTRGMRSGKNKENVTVKELLLSHKNNQLEKVKVLEQVSLFW